LILVLSSQFLHSEDVINIFNKVKYYSELKSKISLEVIESDQIKTKCSPLKNNSDYLILISTGMIDTFADNDDLIGFSIAHELGHIALSHFNKNSNSKNEILKKEFDRQEELQADKYGLNLVLKSGYSKETILKGLKKLKELTSDYSDYGSLSKHHPSWSERIQIFDDENTKYWELTQEFKNGVDFLIAEEYKLASHFFKNVINKYPQSYEAWANKGYADFMLFCQTLNQEDFEYFNLGYFTYGNFYEKSKSIEAIYRGGDSDIWLNSYSALKASLEINEEQPKVHSLMGLLHLMSPYDGPDYVNAKKSFEKAKLMVGDYPENEIEKLEIEINSLSSEEDYNLRISKLKELSSSIKNLTGNKTINFDYELALKYNRAMLISKSSDIQEKKAAIYELTDFIEQSSSNSIFVQMAYGKYLELSKELGDEVQTLVELRNGNSISFKKVHSVDVEGLSLHLGQSFQDINNIIREFPQINQNLSDRYNLTKTILIEQDIEFLASNKLLSIEIKNPTTGISITEKGINAQTYKLKVGDKFPSLPEKIKKQFIPNTTFIQARYLKSKHLGIALKLENSIIKSIKITNL
jgi:hypothetical protein